MCCREAGLWLQAGSRGQAGQISLQDAVDQHDKEKQLCEWLCGRLLGQ